MKCDIGINIWRTTYILILYKYELFKTERSSYTYLFLKTFQDKICTMTSMRTDPIQLIKVLAMDEAMLDFALPAFLRLLGGCTVHCHKYVNILTIRYIHSIDNFKITVILQALSTRPPSKAETTDGSRSSHKTFPHRQKLHWAHKRPQHARKDIRM